MKIKLFLALGFTLTIMASYAWGAEEAEPASTPVSSTESDEGAGSTEEQDNDEPSTPVEDRFIPSIQISEDLSVSFPVNI